jgi:hypothetical protein
VRRTDENYEVSYGSYCGGICGAGYTAVMSHDADGWHFLWKKQQWIS